MKTVLRFIVLLIAAVATLAAVPQQINYQGFLTRANGAALDTTVAMTFKLYPDSTGGSQLWMESRPAMQVLNGLFNVRLGQLTALTDAVLRSTQLWVGITVGADAEMTPRTQLVSVGYSYRVGTVDEASGGMITGDVQITGRGKIGPNNDNSGNYAFVAGFQNTASGGFSSVGGGNQNEASANYSSVVGGQSGTASGSNSVVAGGFFGNATAYAATVGGGSHSNATANYATVSGGHNNVAAGNTSTVCGGESNHADSAYSTVSGGNTNVASGRAATVSGGHYNTASGDSSVICGGGHNTASTTGMVIGGGTYNTADGGWGTISGGYHNATASFGAVVAGGGSNTSSGYGTTVSGGLSNVAGNYYSVVPGGLENRATGNYSFAAGYRAQTNGNGVFAWADATGDTFSIGLANSFNARAAGGFRFWTTSDYTQNIGARLPAGGSSWTTLSDSTKKRNIRLVDTKEVLNRVAQMPIKQWSYKSQDPSIEHIGPMAQDFWRLFHIGDDSLSISTIDPGGIALAAIQELAKENTQLKQEIRDLRVQVQSLTAGQQKALKEEK